MEPQQSTLYAKYMMALKWTVIEIDGIHIFLKRFPLFGGIAKIHRPQKLPNAQKLIPILQSHKIKTLVIEPIATQNQQELNQWCLSLARYVKVNTAPYLPTKTIRIDVTPKEDEIFHSFSEAKRRAVRRATKLNVSIKQSTSIDDLIRIKNKSSGLFGFITTTGIKKLWPIFAPQHSAILLAYSGDELIGGVLLLFWDTIAYYWIAGATKKGKKLYAPTLLVWEALKLSKKHGAKLFDLVGVWDERIPKQNTDWKGFTKFKEGFGGKTLYYPLVLNK